MCCFTNTKPKSWTRFLPWAEYWYNTSFHTATCRTPFRIVYGRDPPPLLTYEVESSVFLEVDQQLNDRDVILAELHQHLHKAQQRMKSQEDSKLSDVSFEIGDLFLLKLRPYRHHSLAHWPNEKLSPHFYGPFKILAKIGPMTYCMQLPDTTRIHPVFHISQLKQAQAYFSSVPSLPPQLEDTLELHLEPEAVLGIRPSSGSSSAAPEVLIKWKHLQDHEVSWEPLP